MFRVEAKNEQKNENIYCIGLSEVFQAWCRLIAEGFASSELKVVNIVNND